MGIQTTVSDPKLSTSKVSDKADCHDQPREPMGFSMLGPLFLHYTQEHLLDIVSDVALDVASGSEFEPSTTYYRTKKLSMLRTWEEGSFSM